MQQESTWSEEEEDDDMEGMSSDEAGSRAEAAIDPATGGAGLWKHTAEGTTDGGDRMAGETAGVGSRSEEGQQGPIDDSYIQVHPICHIL